MPPSAVDDLRRTFASTILLDRAAHRAGGDGDNTYHTPSPHPAPAPAPAPAPTPAPPPSVSSRERSLTPWTGTMLTVLVLSVFVVLGTLAAVYIAAGARSSGGGSSSSGDAPARTPDPPRAAGEEIDLPEIRPLTDLIDDQ